MHALIGDDDRIVTDDDASSLGADADASSPSSMFFPGIFKRRRDSNNAAEDAESGAGMNELKRTPSLPIAQHYNPDRTLIYDHVNASRDGSLSVAMEQVSIFLINDGTVISFFQVVQSVLSADFRTVAEP